MRYDPGHDAFLVITPGGGDVRLIRGLWQPADPGVDTRRGPVAIPLVLQDARDIAAYLYSLK